MPAEIVAGKDAEYDVGTAAADLAAGGRVLKLRDVLPGDGEQPRAAGRARAQDLGEPRARPQVPGPAGARAEDQLQAHQAAGRVSGESAGGDFGLHL